MLTVLVTPELAGQGAGAGVMFEGDASLTETYLRTAGWTLLTAVNLMLFSLLHNPCSTTIYTIYKETRSVKWTTVATLLPVVDGCGRLFPGRPGLEAGRRLGHLIDCLRSITRP